MSKLSIVRQSLEANPNVVIVKVDDQKYFPNADGFWSHKVDYIVAPRRGLYTADELQPFMMSLVPDGLAHSSVNHFSQYPKKLIFGTLYFDEKVGEEERILTLTDEELFDADIEGFTDGKITVKQDLQRRTWVRPYPNEAFARDVIEGRLEYRKYKTDSETLRKYERGLVRA